MDGDLFCARYALKTMGYPNLALTAAQVGVRILEHAADGLQSAADRGAQEVYGCLHILAGFEAAVALRAADAQAHLGLLLDRSRAGTGGGWQGPGGDARAGPR